MAELWDRLITDDRGAVPIKTGVTLIVGFLVIGLLASVLLPEAINQTVDVNTSRGTGVNGTESWGTIETTLWDLLPMAYVLAVFLFVIALAVDQFG